MRQGYSQYPQNHTLGEGAPYAAPQSSNFGDASVNNHMEAARLNNLQRAVDALENRLVENQAPAPYAYQNAPVYAARPVQTRPTHPVQMTQPNVLPSGQTAALNGQPHAQAPYQAGAEGSMMHAQATRLANQAAQAPLETLFYPQLSNQGAPAQVPQQHTVPQVNGTELNASQAAATASELSMLAAEITNRQHMLNQTSSLQATVQQEQNNMASNAGPAAPPMVSAPNASLPKTSNAPLTKTPTQEAPKSMTTKPKRSSASNKKLDAISKTLVALQGELIDLKAQVAKPVIAQKTVQQDEIDRIANAVSKMQKSSTLDDSAFQRLHSELNALRTELQTDVQRAVRREIATSNGIQSSDISSRMDERLNALQAQFEDLSQNFNRTSLQTANAVSPRVDTLANQLDTLRNTVEDLPQTLAITRLEDHLAEVMAKMEQLNEQQTAMREAAQMNQAASAQAVSGSVVTADDIASIEGRLDEVARALVAVSNAHMGASQSATAPTIDMSGIERLEARFAELAGTVDEISDRDNTADLQNIAIRIDGLNERLGSFEKYAENGDLGGASAMFASPDVGQIEEQLRALNEQVAHNAAHSQTAQLEEQLQRLTMRFDEAAEINSTGAQISNLEAQIGQIIHHLNNTEPQAGNMAAVDLTPMEMRLGQIEHQLVSQQSFSLEAAQQAAQQAVTLMGSNSEPAQIITALSQDLRTLQEAAEAGNTQTYQTVAGMQDMLTKVVDRLGTIEGSIKEASKKAEEASKQAVKASKQAAKVVQEAPVRFAEMQTAIASDQTVNQTNFATDTLTDISNNGNARVAAPALDPTNDMEHSAFGLPQETYNPAHDAPLEPGSMAPNLDQMVQNASAELHATKQRLDNEQPQNAFTDAPMPKMVLDGYEDPNAATGYNYATPENNAPYDMNNVGGDLGNARPGSEERPDAVAAARRALQATTAEMNAVREEAKSEKKASGLAGKLPAVNMDRLRKPLVMGAAALLLAIMAFQGANMFLGGDSNETVAKVDKPAAIEQSAKPASLEQNAKPADTAKSDAPQTTEVAEATTDEMAKPIGKASREVMPQEPTSQVSNAADTITSEPMEKMETAAQVTTPAPTQASLPADETPNAAAQEAPTPKPDTAASGGIEVPSSAGSRALVTAASNGDPKALFQVGMRYSDGTDVTRNMTESARYFKASADKGFAPAQYSIGSLYEKGIGVERNVLKAAEWYEKAALQGNARAMHNLAVIHAMGNPPSVQPNMDKAVGWFQKAADYGIKDSQFNMGILYGQGMGVPQNLADSYKWFALAAKSGDADSAAKRDEVANAMDPSDLDEARRVVNSWAPKKISEAANRVAIPKEWQGKGTRERSASQANGSSTMVKKAQAMLNQRGFEVGTPDGLMGPKTKRAIMEFQRSAGIPVTGKVDGKLVQALGIQA